LVLCVIVIVKILRPNTNLTWLLFPFIYFIFVTVFVLAWPGLPYSSTVYLGSTLTAVAPCMLAVIVLATKNNLKVLMFCMLALYSWGAGYLQWEAPTVNQFGMFLRSPLLISGLCLLLLALVARHVHHLIMHGRKKVQRTSLWVVGMPWVSLIPAFYFANLGTGWFLLFALANVIIGLMLISKYVSFPVGPSKLVSGEADGEADSSKWTKSENRQRSTTQSFASDEAAFEPSSVLNLDHRDKARPNQRVRPTGPFKFISREVGRGKGTTDRRARSRWFAPGRKK
jgi:hypothetical protein